MELARTNPCDPVVFQPPRRRRHRHHHHHNHYYSDSDTDSTYSASTYSSDSDDSTYYRVSQPRHARRWLRWPRGVIAYPGYSPWVPPAGAGVGGVLAGGIVQGTGLVGAATVFPQLQTQAQQQQQQPRRYGYRRFHYQGGERVRSGCGHGHGHGHEHHHHHHNRRARSPRRCILPRFGRWLIGDPPERRQWRRCDDTGDCCDQSCGVETTPTVHHEDEYWGPGRTNTVPNWAYGPDGSRNSPWRYGGPNGNTTGGPDAIDPGGTVEEVEEGGTAPVQTAQTLPATTVLPVATAAATDPYSVQQPHTHYHLNDDNGRRSDRRRHGNSHSHSHGHRRRGYTDDGDGILRLVERERRRDSERQMADADASHRREAMMMGLVDRERDRERGGGAGLEARDVLGMLLDREAERRREDAAVAGELGRSSGGGGDGWKGALDALSRRLDEMVLLGGREEGSRRAERVASHARRKKKNTAPRVEFTKIGDGAGAGIRSSGGKKGVASGGKVIFSRGRDGDQDDDGASDADSDETSATSSVGGGTNVTTRGRALRRAGSPSTSVD